MKIELNNDQMEVIKIIQNYPDALSNQKRFASILSDCIPENKALRNALVSAYAEGLIEVIRNGENPQQTIFQCRKRLENNCGIASGLANSAVMIMTYICGKEEWFFIRDTKIDEGTKIRFDCENRRIEFIEGAIEYNLSDNRAVITNVEFKRGNLKQSKAIVVIPEKVEGYEVSGIMPNAFNVIRKEKCKMIMLPSTVRFIGTDDCRLYADFKEKGTYVKPLLYLAKRNYEEYTDFAHFYDKLTYINQEEFFGFECDQAIMDMLEFVSLKSYQDNNDYWTYPSDGRWITKLGVLDRYTGKESHVVIDNCVGVSSDTFVDGDIEEIVFGVSVTSFESGMIHNCNLLRKIIFKTEDRCHIGASAIHHCPQLSMVEWPNNMNYEQISIYNHCPQLGNMVVYRRLLTCQENNYVYELGSDLLRINDRAFVSCEGLKIILVPESVEIIEENAFEDSDITVVIVNGKYTQWKKVHAHNDKHIYIYAKEDSNVMNAVSPFSPQPLVHMKNIKSIEHLLNPVDKIGLADYCREHMDGQSDDEMVLKPYSWKDEIYQKR